MQPSQHMAFKEWAVISAALGEGRQSLIIRKGGIHEGRAGFRVAHDEFWLFPTYVHEGSDGLVDDASSLLERTLAERPEPDTVHLRDYAAVTDVFDVQDPALLVNLTGEHLWAPSTVDERFHYRQPGLFVLTVRMYRRATPIALPNSPHFSGCRSWVELPAALPTDGLQPVLTDAEFEKRRERIRQALSPRGVT